MLGNGTGTYEGIIVEGRRGLLSKDCRRVGNRYRFGGRRTKKRRTILKTACMAQRSGDGCNEQCSEVMEHGAMRVY